MKAERESGRLARLWAGNILGGTSGAVEENMALITAKFEPLIEETIHFPSVIEFRHTPS